MWPILGNSFETGRYLRPSGEHAGVMVLWNLNDILVLGSRDPENMYTNNIGKYTIFLPIKIIKVRRH